MRVIEQLMKYAHPVSANATEDEVNKSMANGTSVYGPLNWGTAVLNDPGFTEFHEVIHVDLPPKGQSPGSDHKPQMGGLGQFINSGGENKEAAFAWMQYFNSGDYTDPAIGDAKVAAGAQPARASILARNQDHNFLAGLYRAFPYTVPYLMQIPEANAIQALMGEECADFVNGEKDIEAALKAMDDRTRRLMGGRRLLRVERARLSRARSRPRLRPAAPAAPSRRRRPEAGCRERQIARAFRYETETL